MSSTFYVCCVLVGRSHTFTSLLSGTVAHVESWPAWSQESIFKTAALLRSSAFAASVHRGASVAGRCSRKRASAFVVKAALFACAAGGTQRAMADAVVRASALGFPFQTQVSWVESNMCPQQFGSAKKQSFLTTARNRVVPRPPPVGPFSFLRLSQRQIPGGQQGQHERPPQGQRGRFRLE